MQGQLAQMDKGWKAQSRTRAFGRNRSWELSVSGSGKAETETEKLVDVAVRLKNHTTSHKLPVSRGESWSAS